MSSHIQERTTHHQPSPSKVALVVFSTVTVAILTAYSLFHWSSKSQQLPESVCQDAQNSNSLIQEDDHQSDSESAEIDETPPSSPSPRNELLLDDDLEEGDLYFDIEKLNPGKETTPAETTVAVERSVPMNHQPILLDAKEASDEEEDVVEEKQPSLYREDAIKIFKGFARNQRSKKGISLKTACLVYKEAWSINKNPRDMILPGRVVQHFKKELPSKFD